MMIKSSKKPLFLFKRGGNMNYYKLKKDTLKYAVIWYTIIKKRYKK